MCVRFHVPNGGVKTISIALAVRPKRVFRAYTSSLIFIYFINLCIQFISYKLDSRPLVLTSLICLYFHPAPSVMCMSVGPSEIRYPGIAAVPRLKQR